MMSIKRWTPVTVVMVGTLAVAGCADPKANMTAQGAGVGADALLDEKNGEPYFEVELTAAPGQLKSKDKVLAITPGMPVEAGILTGSRSVMQYLLKPVLRGVQGALQER